MRYVPTTSLWSHDGQGQWRDGGGTKIETVRMQPERHCNAVPILFAQEAYKEYEAQGHGSQSFARLHERGGFAATEIMMLLYERIQRLQGSAGGNSDGA